MKALLNRFGLLGAARSVRSLAHSVQSRALATVYPDGRFVRCNGAEVYVSFRDPNFRWYFGENKFLEQEHEAFTRLLASRVPGVIIDIGAHWGVFPALLDADQRFAGKIQHVVCIEPDPKNIPQLRKTVSRIKNFPVSIVEAAIGDRDSEIAAFRGGGSCLQTYTAGEEQADVVVSVRTLGTILSGLSIEATEVSHIKIDVDGYEPAFFIGNDSLLQRANPLILTEYWAKGLTSNKSYAIADYWRFLFERYLVVLCNYPAGDYTLLKDSDFERLNEVTLAAVANLLLIPKSERFDLEALGLSS
jgi:FkbM family methyltransferase